MEKKFRCRNCNILFTAKYIRKEYTSPLYGPCVSYVANCPECSSESPEHVEPKRAKATADVAPCGSNSCACPYS